MYSLLQSFRSTLPLVNGSPYILDMGELTTSDGADTNMIDLSWPNYARTRSFETSQPQEVIQNSMRCAEMEQGCDKTNSKMFDVATFDIKDADEDYDDDNWNVRSDYEEKDHVYYVPPGAYRSYVPESCRSDEETIEGCRKEDDGKDGKLEQRVANVFKVLSHLEYGDESCDDEEKDVVYQMPSGAYRSYELGSWNTKKEEDKWEATRDDGNAEETVEVNREHEGTQDIASDRDAIDFSVEKSEKQSKTSSNGMNQSFDDYLDMTTAQSMANRPHIPIEKFSRRDLCRVCRNFHDAKNAGSERHGARLVKKLMSWRKKSHKETCARCGYGIDRRSFLLRMFGFGRKTGGTY